MTITFSDFATQTDVNGVKTLYDRKYFSSIPHRWRLSFPMKIAAASLMRLQDTFTIMGVEMNRFNDTNKTYIYKYFNANGLQ